jgi:hypothetical protein
MQMTQRLIHNVDLRCVWMGPSEVLGPVPAAWVALSGGQYAHMAQCCEMRVELERRVTKAVLIIKLVT